MRRSCTDKHMDKVTAISEEFLDHLETLIHEETGALTEDLGAEVYKWALETITAISLDTRLDCVGSAPSAAHMAMITAVQGVLTYSKKLDLGLRLWEMFPSKDFNIFLEHYQTFKHSATNLIKESTMEDEDTNDTESLVAQLTKAGCSKEVTTAAVMELMFGGVDTTAHTVIFILYLLATNPRVQERLFSELENVNIDKVIDHPYLRAVIKEGMRLLPVAPANIRCF